MDAFTRFEKYAGQYVALQLRTGLFMLSYAGTSQVDGKEMHHLQPAIANVATPDGPKAQAVGFAELIPAALLEIDAAAGEIVLKMRDPATKAEISVGVPPEEIRYITRAKPPAVILSK